MNREIGSGARKAIVGAIGLLCTGILVGCDGSPNGSGVDQCYAGVCSGQPGNRVVTGQQLPPGSQASPVTVTPDLPNLDGEPPVWPTLPIFNPRATYQAPTAPPKAGPDGQVATPVVPQVATPEAGLVRGSREEAAPEDPKKKANEIMKRILNECRENGTIQSEDGIFYKGSVRISKEEYRMIVDAYPPGAAPVLSWTRSFTGYGYDIDCGSFTPGVRYPFENE